MADITLCLGAGCKVRKSCYRYWYRPNVSNGRQSWMAACVDKVAFMGKKRVTRRNWW